ncbi:hypothetical protein IAR55_006504 [Kwoniella newhampshirensis]|uniref:non-specific serine/threonine protein kinase n=1 Tax=Kwoniella newhampshirensis TaxID=1651941 RepID=A0AAW0YX34_9TREE
MVIPNAISREQAYIASLAAQPKDVPPERLYEKLEIVGKGAYGAVYRGKHISTGHVVALKIINLDTEDDDVADIQKEIALLQQLMLGGSGATPNVIKYYGSLMEGPKVWIIMEYAEGGSIRTLSRARPLKELHICLIMREVLIALAFLHKNGVIHRDLKAANILLTTFPPRILLCDFGVAALLQSSTSKRSTFVGTPYWMAPEVVTEGRLYDAKADIWSLGITSLEMAYGEPPMSGQPAARAVMLLGDKRMRAPKLEGDHWTKEMREFVVGCLNEEPSDRLPAEELGKVRWIKQQGKTPLTALNDLVSRYQAWKESGGQRQSLAAGVGASVEDDVYEQESDGDWAFDTVRSRMSMLVDEKAQIGEIPLTTLSPPTARPAPQSLRRLFHDETSSDPDPFQSFALQQPGTPQSSDGSGAIEQVARFPSPEQEEYLGDDVGYDPSTIRQGRLGRTGRSPTPLSVSTDLQILPDTVPTPSTSTYRIDSPQADTPMGKPDVDLPSPRQMRTKMSLDTLSSVPTSKSQQPEDIRLKSGPGARRPGGSMGEGLRGFQFPLVSQSTSGPSVIRPAPQPPTLHRMHSAAPTMPGSAVSPTRSFSSHGALPTRPPMMRQASVAVMEGRAASQSQAHAQAFALAQSQEGPMTSTRNLAIPGSLGPRPMGGMGMMRSRSGSRVEEGQGVVGLRDLLKLSPAVPEIPDLLPPSPSVASTPHKFLPAPSPLAQNNHQTPPVPSLPITFNLAAANALAQMPVTPAPVSACMPSDSGISTRAPHVANHDIGPPIRPLDLSRLDTEDVFAELEKTVDDMQKWLGCVQSGLDDLMKVNMEPIASEG